VDGLVLKITNDLIVSLERRGLTLRNLRVKFLSRDSTLVGGEYRTYVDSNAFYSVSLPILNDIRYLCSAGTFPVLDNVVVTNTNFPFKNEYSWTNITNSRNLVKSIESNNQFFAQYQIDTERYVELMLELFDGYIANVNSAINARLSAYVDPCYVDDGYVSPN
jgi:hypothetical protein